MHTAHWIDDGNAAWPPHDVERGGGSDKTQLICIANYVPVPKGPVVIASLRQIERMQVCAHKQTNPVCVL